MNSVDSTTLLTVPERKACADARERWSKFSASHGWLSKRRALIAGDASATMAVVATGLATMAVAVRQWHWRWQWHKLYFGGSDAADSGGRGARGDRIGTSGGEVGCRR